MRPVTVAAFLIALGPVAAQAYPIFYKCDASGHVDDVLDSKDIREKVLALPLPTQADIDSKIAKICEDNAECFAILKQAFLLTQDTASAANELYEREVRKIEEKLRKIGRTVSASTAASASSAAQSVSNCGAAASSAARAAVREASSVWRSGAHQLASAFSVWFTTSWISGRSRMVAVVARKVWPCPESAFSSIVQ